MKAPLVHLVRRPEGAPHKPPLLVLLHGVGSNEEDLFGLESEFDPSWVVVSARAPLTLRPGSYAWFEVRWNADGPEANPAQAEKARVRLGEFVAWAVSEYGADPEKVLVAGFSQGAIMTASLALTQPEVVKAAVLMSGRILPEVVPLVASAERRARPRYLIVHGTLDEVLPVKHGRESRELLRSLGIEPDYREFPMPHTVSDTSLALVVEWLGDQARH